MPPARSWWGGSKPQQASVDTEQYAPPGRQSGARFDGSREFEEGARSGAKRGYSDMARAGRYMEHEGAQFAEGVERYAKEGFDTARHVGQVIMRNGQKFVEHVGQFAEHEVDAARREGRVIYEDGKRFITGAESFLKREFGAAEQEGGRFLRGAEKYATEGLHAAEQEGGRFLRGAEKYANEGLHAAEREGAALWHEGKQMVQGFEKRMENNTSLSDDTPYRTDARGGSEQNIVDRICSLLKITQFDANSINALTNRHASTTKYFRNDETDALATGVTTHLLTLQEQNTQRKMYLLDINNLSSNGIELSNFRANQVVAAICTVSEHEVLMGMHPLLAPVITLGNQMCRWQAQPNDVFFLMACSNTPSTQNTMVIDAKTRARLIVTDFGATQTSFTFDDQMNGFLSGCQEVHFS